MNHNVNSILNKNAERKFHNREVVFEFEYFINLYLKVKCGFSVIGFTPVIWLHNAKKNFIGLYREEWMHLMTYKDYIQIRLDQYDFFDSYNILNDGCLDNLTFDFQTKRGRCFLILKQQDHKIKIDSETWRAVVRAGIFLTTFLCWNSLLRKQIAYFYFNFYIPTCAELKKISVQLNEVKGCYDKDVEVDLTRLCYEFGKKMVSQIKTDVKIYKLTLRIDNK